MDRIIVIRIQVPIDNELVPTGKDICEQLASDFAELGMEAKITLKNEYDE